MPVGKPGKEMESKFRVVMFLEVSSVSPEYLLPWQVGRQVHARGSGFAISGRRILTNFHVVDCAAEIRVRKYGLSERWSARVICSAADVDLALVEVVDEAGNPAERFWEGVRPVEFCADLPELQSAVSVVGYPTGGRTVCITQGVVSRVDCRNYRLGRTEAASPGQILVIQIDAAINGGNSGGPCFSHDGRVVGVAFQGLGGDAQAFTLWINYANDCALLSLQALRRTSATSSQPAWSSPSSKTYATNGPALTNSPALYHTAA